MTPAACALEILGFQTLQETLGRVGDLHRPRRELFGLQILRRVLDEHGRKLSIGLVVGHHSLGHLGERLGQDDERGHSSTLEED